MSFSNSNTETSTMETTSRILSALVQGCPFFLWPGSPSEITHDPGGSQRAQDGTQAVTGPKDLGTSRNGPQTTTTVQGMAPAL